MKCEQQYIELYEEAAGTIKAKSCDVMNAVRDEAFRTFQHQGFPTQKVERYKYTDVATAFAPNYGLSLAPILVKPSPYIFTFKDAPLNLAPYYNKVADQHDALSALNTALAHEGLLIYVPKNHRPDNPIQVDNYLPQPLRKRGDLPGNSQPVVGEAVMQNRRVLILLEENAEATVIVNDRSPHPTSSPTPSALAGTSPIMGRLEVTDIKDDDTRMASLPIMGEGRGEGLESLLLQVVEIFCKPGSHLDLYEVEETTAQCRRFSNVYIQAERDSSVKHNVITLFNGQSRNLCDVYLTGENAEVTLNGCAIGSDRQHIDNNTLIEHRAPRCQSTELYKYVLDGQAVGAFAGKILVQPGAQQTTSQETNANLCASPDARMYTQPMLEIYADDVKCNHGSTVGVMDEAALFYMRQRGIPEAEARTLLKNAFMGQVIDQIQHRPLRDRLYVKVEKRFRGELEKCDDCRLCK